MELSRTEQMLLEAISAAIRGASVSWTTVSEEEWDALMTMAAQHKVQPLVLNAVFSCPAAVSWKQTEIQKSNAKRQIFVQTVKTTEFLSLYRTLREAGLCPLVLKGILCRTLYPSGDLRQSSDEDLFVSEAEFGRCCEVLRSFGMQPISEEDETTADEIGWRKTGSPLYIELHRVLFDSRSAATRVLEPLFSDAFAAAREYPLSSGVTVKALSPHDHLLYLLLHAYKHFIHSGFGIRQIADIGLWARNYSQDIQWELLYEQCSQVHARKFSAAVFRIANIRLGISVTLPERWAQIEMDDLPMLLDLLPAGVYGKASMDRVHTASVTLNAVSARQSNRRGGLNRTIFPKRRVLERDYPILKKYGILLPFIWVKRLVIYLKQTKNCSAGNAFDTVKLAQERKNLLKQYDIL